MSQPSFARARGRLFPAGFVGGVAVLVVAVSCGAADKHVRARDDDGNGGDGGDGLGALGGEVGDEGNGAGHGGANDAANAGADTSGNAAGAGATAAASGPLVLVPFPNINTLSSPSTIMADDEYVYWVSSWVGPDPAMPPPPRMGQYLLRMPKAGGEPKVVFDLAEYSTSPPCSCIWYSIGATFIMDATNVYLVTGQDTFHSLIFKVPKDGSGATQLAQPTNYPGTFAVDAESLYFDAKNPGAIDSVSLAGGPIVPVIDPDTTPLPDGFDYFPAVNGLTSDDTNLYYSGNDQGIFKVPKTGGTPVLLHPRNMPGATISGPHSWPAAKDGVVYWNFYGYIYEVSIDGGDVSTLVEPTDAERSDSGPNTVIYGDYVYYRDRGVQKAALDGSSRVTLLEDTGAYNATELTVDDTGVYMFAYSGQGVIKVSN